MPEPRTSTGKASRSPQACDLCGLPLRRGASEARHGDRIYVFCCTGCRQVFSILLQATGAADPEAFRRSELFRECQASGIIPRSEADIPDPLRPAASPGAPAAREGLTLSLKVENMWCPACAWLIEQTLGRTAGVASASCRFATDRLEVRYDPTATDPARIRAALARFGYATTVPGEGAEAVLRRREWVRFGVSAFLTMNIMMLSAALYFGFFTDLGAESVASLSWPMAAMAAGVLAFGGAPIFRRAAGGLANAAFSMETLIAIGALSAFGLSARNLLAGSIHLYFDTAGMLVTLVLLGKLLEGRAKDRVLEGLNGFLALMPVKVRLVTEAWPEGRFTAARNLAAGDLFRVLADEVVAADGVVVSGGGSADESSITGEPVPRVKRPGDRIRSGSRVHRGDFTVCADKVGAESTLGQMVAVVGNTLRTKTPGEIWTEKLLRGFVPAIVLLAAATGAVAGLAGAGADAAVLRSLTVLVIACPCALGIAVPLTRVAGVALAAGRGMLVRSFSAFERAPQIDTLVLDKTGTVTEGAWRLAGILPLGGFSAERALALAAGLEQGADHPVAAEIIREARERHIRPERVALVQPEPNGVSGLWEGLEARIGSAGFLAEEFAGGPHPPAEPPADAAGRSVVHLSAGGRPAAVFAFGDALRPGVEAALALLKRRGYRLALVSGDGREATGAVARQLGIAEFHGGFLPADKADFIRGLQRQGKKVAMAGDGVNDAPAIALADLSLAMYGGGNLGRDVADVTLMRAAPEQIDEFLDFARAVNRSIRQNLGLTFAYNLAGISLAVAGLLTPLAAVCAMLLSSLSVIGNTLRLVGRYSARRP
jgi:heavy metal translocating P-type ATPase